MVPEVLVGRFTKMELNRTEEVMQPFYIQARHAGVSLVLNPSDNHNLPQMKALKAALDHVPDSGSGIVASIRRFSVASILRQETNSFSSFASSRRPSGNNAQQDAQSAGSILSGMLGVGTGAGAHHRHRSSIRHSFGSKQHSPDSPSQRWYMRVEVVDSGPGISAVRSPHLHRRTAKFVISFSKGIVELHGGRISVFSEGVGFGSKFTVELPLVRAPREEGGQDTFSVSSASALDRVDSFKRAFPSLGGSGHGSGHGRGRGLGHGSGHGVRRVAVAVSVPSPKAASGNRGPAFDRLNTIASGSPSMSMSPRASDCSEHFSGRYSGRVHPDSTSIARVLVVDDAVTNRKMLNRVLTTHGYVVIEAVDGSEAVKAVEESEKKLLPERNTESVRIVAFEGGGVVPEADGEVVSDYSASPDLQPTASTSAWLDYHHNHINIDEGNRHPHRPPFPTHRDANRASPDMSEIESVKDDQL
eukprot:gene126-126_t